MIKWDINENGEPYLAQQARPPLIYLDHWALRAISSNNAWSRRLREGIESCGGTLVLSWLNILEFSQVTVRDQMVCAERFINSVIPHLFFMEVEPFSVIQREEAINSGVARDSPPDDGKLCVKFAGLCPKSPTPFTANGLFSSMGGEGLDAYLARLADTVVGRLEHLRQQLSDDKDFQRMVRQDIHDLTLQRGTKAILRELSKSLLVDQRMPITRNHAIDLMHAVVPVSYCETVLLDKHWVAQVGRVKKRFKREGVVIPSAQVFSGKAGKVEAFLASLGG